MKKIRQRILSVILTIAMTITLIPIVDHVEVQAAGSTVFYNIQPTTSFTNGKEYLFSPSSIQTGYCLTSLPSGSALLQATSTSNSCTTQYSSKSGSGNFSKYVNVTQKGTGFDGCTTGGLFQRSGNYMDYICNGGGSGICPGYTYTYDSTTLQPSMVSATINSGVTINSEGSTTLTKSQITMKITISGKTYSVADYTLSDAVVNKSAGDNQLAATFAGVTTYINVKFPSVASDFVMTPTSGSTINIAGNAKNVTVKPKTATSAQTGAITVKYYTSEGTLLTEAPDIPGTYTVKIDVAGGTMYGAASDLEVGTYTIGHVFDKVDGTCIWSPDYKTATLELPCKYCDHVQRLTMPSAVVPEQTTATCLTRGYIKYKVQFNKSTTASDTNWYDIDYDTETANGEDYTYYKETTGKVAHNMTHHQAKDATCEATGNTEYWKCSDCGYYYADENGNTELSWNDIEIPQKEHSFETIEATEPDCTNPGNYEYVKCTDCGNYYVQKGNSYVKTTVAEQEIPANGHNLIKYNGKEETCTTSGQLTYYKCSECNAMFKNSDGTEPLTENDLTVGAKGHTLTFHTYVAPSCTTDGKKAYYECSTCGKTFKSADPKRTDADTDAIADEKLTLKISVNSLTASQITALTIKALGHDYSVKQPGTESTQTPATCTKNATVTYTYKCSRCSATTTGSAEEKPNTALHHKFSAPSCTWATDNSSCTAVFTCETCSDTVTLIAYDDKDNNRTNGKASKITSTTTATCTADGIRTFVALFTPANNVSDYQYRAVDNKNDPALGHILSYTEGQDATCEADGTNAYWTCTRTCDSGSKCEMHFAAASNHEDEANQIIDAAQLQYDDTNSSKYIADLDQYLPISALNHDYKEPVYDWAENGKSVTVTYTCKNDSAHTIVIQGSTDVTEETKTNTSVPIVATQKQAATCTTDGITTYKIEGIYPQGTYSSALSYSSVKDIADLVASGHAYRLNNTSGTEDFDWKTDPVTGDMTATATFICGNDANHTATHEVSVTSEITTPATCTSDGLRTYTGKVTFMGTLYTKTYTESITQLGHDYNKPVFNWYTDTEPVTATASFICKNDPSHVETLPATVTGQIDTLPGCLTEGKTAYTAKVTFNEEEYSDINIVEDIDAAGHALNHVEEKAATCTEKGNIEYWYCEICNKYYAEGSTDTIVEIGDTNGDGVITSADTILAELGHKLSYQKEVAPTCETGGFFESYYCDNCKKYYSDINAENLLTDAEGNVLTTNIISALGHAYQYDAPVYTWSDDGSSAIVSFVCANDVSHTDSYDMQISSEIKTPATCTENGVTTYTATVPVGTQEYTDTKDIADIAALGHTEVIDSAVAATCTTDGKTEGSHCSVCQAVLKKQEVVAKTGHSFTKYVSDNNATETKDGTKTAFCDHGCGKTDTKEDIGSAEALKKQLEDAKHAASVTVIKNKLSVDDATAEAIEDVREKLDVSQEIIALTDEEIQNSTEINGAVFGYLQARATKLRDDSITLKWEKIKDADGYIVYGSSGSKKATYKKLKVLQGNGKCTYKDKKLTSGKYYKYMVVAYKNVNGVNVTIAASKSIYATTTGGEKGVAKSVSIKQVGNQKKTNKITLSIGETAKISATEVKKDKPIKRYRKLSYESSNSDVATVSKKGVITAKGTGTCKIYVYAQNGVYKTIKVTVN